MSIIICYKCDKRVDTDYIEIFESEEFEMVCIDCKEKEEE